MNTSSYLSSARVYSLVMLVAVYLSAELVTGYTRRVNLLVEARHIWAIHFLRGADDCESDKKVEELSATTSEVSGIGNVTVDSLPNTAASSPSVLDPGAASSNDQSNERKWQVTVKRIDGGIWRSLVAEKEIKQESDPVEKLKKIRLEMGLEDSDRADPNSLFRSIEREILDRKVTIPGVEVAFRSDIMPWIISIFTLGLLLMIRNQLRQVTQSAGLAIDEPWIILDGESGLEKIVGGGWLLAIWIAPWIANGCLAPLFSGRVIADGAITTWTMDLAIFSLMGILFVLSGWASLTVINLLIQLRWMRREKLNKLHTAED